MRGAISDDRPYRDPISTILQDVYGVSEWELGGAPGTVFSSDQDKCLPLTSPFIEPGSRFALDYYLSWMSSIFRGRIYYFRISRKIPSARDRIPEHNRIIRSVNVIGISVFPMCGGIPHRRPLPAQAKIIKVTPMRMSSISSRHQDREEKTLDQIKGERGLPI